MSKNCIGDTSPELIILRQQLVEINFFHLTRDLYHVFMYFICCSVHLTTIHTQLSSSCDFFLRKLLKNWPAGRAITLSAFRCLFD